MFKDWFKSRCSDHVKYSDDEIVLKLLELHEQLFEKLGEVCDTFMSDVPEPEETQGEKVIFALTMYIEAVLMLVLRIKKMNDVALKIVQRRLSFLSGSLPGGNKEAERFYERVVNVCQILEDGVRNRESTAVLSLKLADSLFDSEELHSMRPSAQVLVAATLLPYIQTFGAALEFEVKGAAEIAYILGGYKS